MLTSFLIYSRDSSLLIKKARLRSSRWSSSDLTASLWGGLVKITSVYLTDAIIATQRSRDFHFLVICAQFSDWAQNIVCLSIFFFICHVARTGPFGPDMMMSICSDGSFDTPVSHILTPSSAWHLLLQQELLSSLLPVAGMTAVSEAPFEVFLHQPALWAASGSVYASRCQVSSHWRSYEGGEGKVAAALTGRLAQGSP